MNWLMLVGLVLLTIGIAKKLGLILGGSILIGLAILIELM
jgi:hypothetical protein